MKIMEIVSENRPRERMVANGPNALSDAELLAIILQKGTKNINVLDLSNKILKEFSLQKLHDITITQLKSVPGIGEAKALQIKAIFELNKRINKYKNTPKSLSKPKDVFLHMKETVKNLKQEHFYVISLDTKNQVIAEKLISIGSLNSAILHPREIFKEAIINSANSIILIHNHPSGDPSPSEEDITITEEITKASRIMRISILDHIIIGNEKYWSYKEN